MKKAFTLAEVLITLGIIGVVAALTLPNIVRYYKRKESSVRIKKVLQHNGAGNKAFRNR